MITRIAYLLVCLFLLGAVLASCESTPGEVSGMIKYADGRGASVMIVLTNTATNEEGWSGTSNSDGVFYSGKVIPPGEYSVTLFKPDGTKIDHEAKTVTITPDGTATITVTI